MNDERCENCRFARSFYRHVSLVIECRRRSPTVLLRQVDGMKVTASPEVPRDFWCGEFETSNQGEVTRCKS